MKLDQIISLYGEIPSFLYPFLKSRSMQRLKEVGMHCGMEYTSFPFYKKMKPYSRYEHSLGVALIIYHFTKDIKITLSGLFHDIATPSFAHVIDFFNGDYEMQQSTEEKTKIILLGDETIQKELKNLNILTEDVFDYHLYPIADNDSPKLSSDRLEYTLSNLFNYSFASFKEIKEFYGNLVVLKNEDGIDEIGFQDKESAKRFTLLTLKNSHVYVADEDRYAMEYLARILKHATDKNILNENDLYKTEKEVIHILMNSSLKDEFQEFRALKKVTKETKPTNSLSFKIPSKKRYINPLVSNKGRIYNLDGEVKKEIDEFKKYSFDYYVSKI